MNYNKVLNIYGLSVEVFSYASSADTFSQQSELKEFKLPLLELLVVQPDKFSDISEKESDSLTNLDGWVEEDEYEYQKV